MVNFVKFVILRNRKGGKMSNEQRKPFSRLSQMISSADDTGYSTPAKTDSNEQKPTLGRGRLISMVRMNKFFFVNINFTFSQK